MATVTVKHATKTNAAADPQALVDGPTWDNDAHVVTGLDQVDNTSDINKPISTATQTALSAKLTVFNVSAYASMQAAVNAANAATGGVVNVDVPVNLGSGSVGLTLDNTTNVRVTGAGANGNGVIGQAITYSGTGTMFSAKGSIGLEVDHFVATAPNAAFLIDFATGSSTNTTFPQVHDGVLNGKVGTTIIINNVSTVCPKFYNLTIEGGLTGIRGVVVTGGIAAGQYAVKTSIDNCIFQSNLTNGIQGATDWTVSNCTFQGNVIPYAAGFAGTEISILWTGNHMSETTGLVNQITTGAQVFTSIGNWYQPVGGAAITHTGTGGSVISIGDTHSGTGTFVNIGTATNLLTIQGFNPDSAASTAPSIVGTALISNAPAFVAYGGMVIGGTVVASPLTVNSVGNGAAPGNALSILASDFATNGGEVFISKDSGAASAAHIAASDNGAVCPVIFDSGTVQIGGTLAGRRSGALLLHGATSGDTTITTDAIASGTANVKAGTYNFVGDTLTQTVSNKLFGTAFGYATGAGGAVTQITSRTTGVTLNTVSGAITLFTAAPVVGTMVSFTVTNSSVAATDTIIVSVKSATNTYLVFVTAVAAGSFQITIDSVVGTTSDAPVINFAIIKAVSS